MGQRQTTIIPKSVCARILKNAGAKRVSDKASEALAEILEDVAKTIGKKADDNSKHARRKTIRDVDIKLAIKQ